MFRGSSGTPAPSPTGPVGIDLRDAYREHGPGLFGFAYNSLGDRGWAEEVVQEVFVRAWRSGGGYDPRRSSVRTWLYAIARNLIIDAHRSRAARPRVVSSSAPDLPTEDDFTREVDNRLEIEHALGELSPEHREVIVEVHLRGRSYDELSAETGVSTATLRTRAYYGVRAMRKAMTTTGWTA